MGVLFWVSYGLIWAAVVFLGVLMIGTLRHIALQNWRMEQLQATTPSKTNRNGLRPGTPAPEFSLPDGSGKTISLRDMLDRPLLLVFTQIGCGPCTAVQPALEKLARQGEYRVLEVVNTHGEAISDEDHPAPKHYFRVFQTSFQVSKQYEAFATPFAFAIGRDGYVRASGIVNNEQHVRFLLGAQEAKEEALTAH